MTNELMNLTEAQAREAWAVLVAEAGASSDPNDEASFVHEFTGGKPGNEWRFIGTLGFGGKFRFPRLTVDCYPEDETPARRETINRTNTRLAALREAWTVAEA